MVIMFVMRGATRATCILKRCYKYPTNKAVTKRECRRLRVTNPPDQKKKKATPPPPKSCGESSVKGDMKTWGGGGGSVGEAFGKQSYSQAGRLTQ